MIYSPCPGAIWLQKYGRVTVTFFDIPAGVRWRDWLEHYGL